MCDFDSSRLPDLLARLDGDLTMPAARDAECAAAIRALIAERDEKVGAARQVCCAAIHTLTEERDAAVDAEREACAKVCETLAQKARRVGRTASHDDLGWCADTLDVAAEQIRARRPQILEEGSDV